jgi:hypothetical protein
MCRVPTCLGVSRPLAGQKRTVPHVCPSRDSHMCARSWTFWTTSAWHGRRRGLYKYTAGFEEYCYNGHTRCGAHGISHSRISIHTPILMSEYWVSKKKYFCKYCDIYIADDAPSRQHHENGLRHKGNVERFIRGIYKTGEKRKKDQEEEKREMARVEQVQSQLNVALDILVDGLSRRRVQHLLRTSAPATQKPAVLRLHRPLLHPANLPANLPIHTQTTLQLHSWESRILMLKSWNFGSNKVLWVTGKSSSLRHLRHHNQSGRSKMQNQSR